MAKLSKNAIIGYPAGIITGILISGMYTGQSWTQLAYFFLVPPRKSKN